MDLSDAKKALADVAGWNGPNTIVRESLGGSDTNRSWRVEQDHAHFVLRVDTPLAATLSLDRAREMQIRTAVTQAGLAPAVAYADVARGVLISEFQPGRAWTAEDLHDPENLSRLAERLRSLHGLAPIGEPFCLGSTIANYARQLNNVAADTMAREAQALLARIAPRQHVICHNDLLAPNLIDGDRLWLIDWEYAGVGDPLFDLAVVIEHHALPDSLAAPFVQQCLATVDSVVSADLIRYRKIYRRVVLLWTELSLAVTPGATIR